MKFWNIDIDNEYKNGWVKNGWVKNEVTQQQEMFRWVLYLQNFYYFIILNEDAYNNTLYGCYNFINYLLNS